MKKRKFAIVALSFASAASFGSIPADALAQESDVEIGEEAHDLEAEKKFYQMMAKVFDKGDGTPIDPARLELAEKTVGAMLPAGSYAEMFNSLFGDILKPIMEMAPYLDAENISVLTGVEEEEALALDEQKRKDITMLLDPSYKERTEKVLEVIMPLIEEAMGELEPAIRQGMARAYARKFTPAQLTDINGFFATSTGSLFAAESFQIQADPEIMQATMQAMPAMMDKLMASFTNIDKDIEALPKQKSLSDLSELELKQLAKLLGITSEKLEENRKTLAAAEKAAEDTATTSDDFGDETGEESWYDSDNWSVEDREREAKLSDEYDEIYETSSAAYDAWEKAFNKAVANARARLKPKSK